MSMCHPTNGAPITKSNERNSNPSVVTVVRVEHEGKFYELHANWLLSSYQCIYGNGCPGFFGKQSAELRPDTGCCANGATIQTKADYERMEQVIPLLTEEDMDKERLQVVRKKGGIYKIKDRSAERDGDYKPDRIIEDDFVGSTRVLDRACIFANRLHGSAGKPGCALHHLAARLGKPITETKPLPCFWVPLRIGWGSTEFGTEDIVRVGPTTIESWEHYEPQESWASWWCVDAPEAYISERPLYRTYEQELRYVFGDVLYEKMVKALQTVPVESVEPMPGAVRNEGRPLLPLMVGNRKPYNDDKAFEAALASMKTRQSILHPEHQ